MPRNLQRLLLPLGLLAALAVADVYLGGIQLRRWPHLPLVVRVSSVVVLLLAWRLRRGRIAWAVAGIWLAAEIPHMGTSVGAPAAEVLAALAFATSIVLPLHLAAAAVMPEFWLVGAAGAVRFGVLGLEAAFVAWLASPSGLSRIEKARSLDAVVARLGAAESETGVSGLASLGVGWVERIPLPAATLCAFLLAALVTGFAVLRRRSPLESGLAAALAATFLAFLLHGGSELYLSAAVLLLAFALVENAVGLAFHDGLTGLPARRALEERLAQLGRTYAVAMLDLDRFKKLNDRHGHEVGDQVLRLVAARLAGVGGGGEPFRYGGEEFTVLFPGTTAAEARPHLEVLRQSIAGRKFTVRSPGRPKAKPKGPLPRPSGITKELTVTVSIGVAERGERHSSSEEVLKAADRALYRSKKAGRNRVTVAR